jgi:hypothetical protein
MTGVMFRNHAHSRELSRRVAQLPSSHTVRRTAGHWVVLGPTGLVVVGRCADGDVAGAAERCAAVAHELRGLLAGVTPWVPFVDALVVADGEHHDLACTVVQLDLLVTALTIGPVTLDEGELTVLERGLRSVVASLSVPRPRPLDPA